MTRTKQATCAHGHNDWRTLPSGRRYCRTCQLARSREAHARKTNAQRKGTAR